MQHIADAEAHAKYLHAAQLQWAESGTNAEFLQTARTRAVLRVAVQQLGATYKQMWDLRLFMERTWSVPFERHLAAVELRDRAGETGHWTDLIGEPEVMNSPAELLAENPNVASLLWSLFGYMWADVVIETDRWARANSGALTA